MNKALNKLFLLHPNGPEEGRLDFEKQVDDSPYTSDEFIDALQFFQAWLKKRNRPVDLKCMLGYLNCCIEESSRIPGQLNLVGLLELMLEEHGYEG